MAHASVWVCGAHTFDLSIPRILGILNVTPDSFSDGGSYASVKDAVEHAKRMVADGADLIDVGGESTRPGAALLPIADELARVIPVVDALVAEGIAVSVDTYKPQVAQAALSAGASVINDITGFRDPDMIAAVSSSKRAPGVIVMHMKGTPQTMQDAPEYKDVVCEVKEFLLDRTSALENAGVSRQQVALDPGFGFGKFYEHNLEILRRTQTFAELRYPLVVAVSRKRTIGEISGVENPRDRVIGSISAALFAIERGARIVRTHDVRETKQALLTYDALAREARE